MLRPSIRLFAMNAGAADSTLRGDAAHRDSTGRRESDLPATLEADTTWAPTTSITPQGAGGAWRIDDVYIDPYKMH